jgi:hypothetical protein
MDNARTKLTILRPVTWLSATILLSALLIACGSGAADKKPAAQKTQLQTVSFQAPEDPGSHPFTKPADVKGRRTVPVSSGANSGGSGGSQPFGGSGSNRVCDRDKLIRFLKANPERMREWTRVLGVSPSFSAVKRYIAKLHPVTLTRDTQITNHAYRNGRAVPFQAILQAGTAVLVDKYGTPVVRCYCGNPLKPAVFTKTAKCTGCPPHYTPPRQCTYDGFDDYDETYYRRSYYSNADYDEVFIRRHRRSRYGDCYEPYPDPPEVTIVNVFNEPQPPPQTQSEPPPQTQTEPPPQAQPTPQPQPASPPSTPEPSGLQCDPPRSQLESEQCAARRGEAPQTAPPPQTTTTPDICHDGLDNEGVPGKVDGDDPNCP